MIFSEEYIRSHFEDIKTYASVIERRLEDSDLSMEELIRDNRENLRLCREYGCRYILIDKRYEIDFNIENML